MPRQRTRLPIIVTTLALGLSTGGCVRILQNEVGVERKLGKIEDEVLQPGPNGINPFSTRVFRLSTQTENLEIEVGLPSKEGLTVSSEISILYRIDPAQAPKILRTVGPGYEEALILPVFRSASADVCARYFAKDMHSSKRAEIEREIQESMMHVVAERGFVIESVLMKSIVLPTGLARAIESKLEAEQESQRMEFVLSREKQEVQRRIITAEAERQIAEIQADARGKAAVIEAQAQAQAATVEADGAKQANETIRSSLTGDILRYLSIEAFRELAKSNNAKVVVTDGKGVILDAGTR